MIYDQIKGAGNRQVGNRLDQFIDKQINALFELMDEYEIEWITSPVPLAHESGMAWVPTIKKRQKSMDDLSPEEKADKENQKDWDNKTNILVDKFGNYFNNLLGLQAQLETELSNILGMMQAAKQAQLQQNYSDTSATLQEGIAQETMTTRQFGELKLGNNLDAMQSKINELRTYGYDVSGLEKDKARYEEITKAKIAKAEEQAKTDMINDTALTKARLSGDEKRVERVANAEFDITKTALGRAREQKEKDTGDPTLAGQWYEEKLKEAERQRQQTIRDGQIEEYNSRIQHNEMLKDLEGKTQAEIDRLNREELQKKLSYLDAELKKTELTTAARRKLEQEKVVTVQKNRELDSRDPAKAAEEAKRRLKDRTTDYAAIMIEPFDRINSSMEKHFTAMLTGAESFSKGFKGIFQDMTTAITNMMIKMWYNKFVLGPLEKWWGNLLDGWFGGAKAGSISKEENAEIDAVSKNFDWQSPSTDRSFSTLPPVPKINRGSITTGQSYLFGEIVPEQIIPTKSAGSSTSSFLGYKNLWTPLKGGNERYARGGIAHGWSLVGEEGPEFVNFTSPGGVYSAKDTQKMLSQNNVAVKPISIQMHVHGVQNAESFRQSQGQIIAGLGRAISSSVRRNT